VIAIAVGIAVAAVCGSSLVALRMWLAHKEKSYAHAPLAVLEQRINEIESRLLSGAMRR